MFDDRWFILVAMDTILVLEFRQTTESLGILKKFFFFKLERIILYFY